MELLRADIDNRSDTDKQPFPGNLLAGHRSLSVCGQLGQTVRLQHTEGRRKMSPVIIINRVRPDLPLLMSFPQDV